MNLRGLFGVWRAFQSHTLASKVEAARQLVSEAHQIADEAHQGLTDAMIAIATEKAKIAQIKGQLTAAASAF